jgi:phenylacetate-CoA ligase
LLSRSRQSDVQSPGMFDQEKLRQDVYQRVPAYRQFLERAGVAADAAWEQLPLTNKSDYLLAYPFEQLIWDGDLSRCHFIGCSSGFSKSGSIFWPKRPEDERHYLEGLRQTLIDHYAIDRKPTLILVCLAFGTWIAGVQMAATMRAMAIDRQDLPITVCTPGLNLSEAADICARFQDHFQQFLWITNPSNLPLIATLLQRRQVPTGGGRHSFAVLGEYYSQEFRHWVASSRTAPTESGPATVRLTPAASGWKRPPPSPYAAGTTSIRRSARPALAPARCP